MEGLGSSPLLPVQGMPVNKISDVRARRLEGRFVFTQCARVGCWLCLTIFNNYSLGTTQQGHMLYYLYLIEVAESYILRMTLNFPFKCWCICALFQSLPTSAKCQLQRFNSFNHKCRSRLFPAIPEHHYTALSQAVQCGTARLQCPVLVLNANTEPSYPTVLTIH